MFGHTRLHNQIWKLAGLMAKGVLDAISFGWRRCKYKVQMPWHSARFHCSFTLVVLGMPIGRFQTGALMSTQFSCARKLEFGYSLHFGKLAGPQRPDDSSPRRLQTNCPQRPDDSSPRRLQTNELAPQPSEANVSL